MDVLKYEAMTRQVENHIVLGNSMFKYKMNLISSNDFHALSVKVQKQTINNHRLEKLKKQQQQLKSQLHYRS